jgi:hypothetical protein
MKEGETTPEHETPAAADVVIEPDTDLDTCCICLEALDATKNDLVALNCPHVIHKTCFEKYRDSKFTTCPLCRIQFAEAPPLPLRSVTPAHAARDDGVLQHIWKILLLCNIMICLMSRSTFKSAQLDAQWLCHREIVVLEILYSGVSVFLSALNRSTSYHRFFSKMQTGVTFSGICVLIGIIAQRWGSDPRHSLMLYGTFWYEKSAWHLTRRQNHGWIFAMSDIVIRIYSGLAHLGVLYVCTVCVKKSIVPQTPSSTRTTLISTNDLHPTVLITNSAQAWHL